MKERSAVGVVIGKDGVQRPFFALHGATFYGDDTPMFEVDGEGVKWSVEKDPVTGATYKVRL